MVPDEGHSFPNITISLYENLFKTVKITSHDFTLFSSSSSNQKKRERKEGMRLKKKKRKKEKKSRGGIGSEVEIRAGK